MKNINLLKLKSQFNLEKFYNTLFTDKKPKDLIKELKKNIGLGNFDFFQNVIDKKYPLISIEDGSLFTFLNKSITCDVLFFAKKDKNILSDFIDFDESFTYIFLLKLKERSKSFLVEMKYSSKAGLRMYTREVISKNLKSNVLLKKVISLITHKSLISYQFIFLSKKLNVNIKKFSKFFVNVFKQNIPVSTTLYPNFIRNLDVYIFQLDPKIKIPFLSNIDVNSVYDYYSNYPKKKNFIELKEFKKGKIEKFLGRKVEVKNTKKFKIEPLLVHRFLKDDWKKIQGKLTGTIYL